MGRFRSFAGITDTREVTIATIIDEAFRARPPGIPETEAITPEGLVVAAAAYGIVLTPEHAAASIYTRAAYRCQA